MLKLKIKCSRSHRRAGFEFVKGVEKDIELDGVDAKKVLAKLEADSELHVVIVDGKAGSKKPEANKTNETTSAPTNKSEAKAPEASSKD